MFPYSVRSIGWKIPKKSMNVGDGINVLVGKFCKNLMIVGELSTFFSFKIFEVSEMFL